MGSCFSKVVNLQRAALLKRTHHYRFRAILVSFKQILYYQSSSFIVKFEHVLACQSCLFLYVFIINRLHFLLRRYYYHFASFLNVNVNCNFPLLNFHKHLLTCLTE